MKNYNNNIFKILIQKVDLHLITSEVSLKCGKRNPQGIGFTMTGNNDNEAEYGGRIKSQKIEHFKIILFLFMIRISLDGCYFRTEKRWRKNTKCLYMWRKFDNSKRCSYGYDIIKKIVSRLYLF